MQKFLKQQSRDRALGSSNSNSPQHGKTEAGRHLQTTPAAFPCRFVRQSTPQTAQNGNAAFLPRYAHVQIQRQIEEWEYKSRRRQRNGVHRSVDKTNNCEGEVVDGSPVQQDTKVPNSVLLGNISEQLRKTQAYSERSDAIPHNFFPATVGVDSFHASRRGESTQSVASERLPQVIQSVVEFPASSKMARKLPRTAASLPEQWTDSRGATSRPHTSDPSVNIRRGGAREYRNAVPSEQIRVVKPNKPGN